MDFQALVMAAGKGSRMMEITSSVPKCLLPVGNFPVIRSCLRMLKTAGVHQIIVVVSETEKTKVQEAIESKCGVKVEVVAVPKNEDWGTADSLRHVKDKIHSDLIIVSCDLATNFDLRKMLLLHHKHDSTLTMLLSPWPKTFKDTLVPGRKGKHKQEKDVIGMDRIGRLMFFNSEADLEDGVPMKLSVLRHHPVLQVHSDLMDAHVYVMKKCLVDFITGNNYISTLKGEFLPVVVAEQFSKKPMAILQDDSQVMCSNGNTDSLDSLDLKKLALKLSSWNDSVGTLEETYCGDVLKCFAYVNEDGFCLRANTLVAYAEMNRQISRHIESVMGVSRTSPYQKSQVDFDSLVGEGCELMAKSSVKQSVVGNQCCLNEKVKILSSVLMDNVNIQAGSSVQGCIICSNVNVGSNCELKNCVIGSDQTIADGAKLSNELIQGEYELMEI